MNIYDFDNTIFKGDSSYKFIIYSLFRHPFIVIISLFKGLIAKIKNKEFKIIKSEIFSFVKYIKDFDNYMDKYINKNMKNIKEFYSKNKKEDDVVISASFDFIIERFCQKLNIKYVISSKYDVSNGHIIGENCKGEEKVKALYLYFNKPVINEAYSDSYSDLPMLKLAKRAYLVKNDKITLINVK